MTNISCNDVVSSIFKKKQGEPLSPEYIRNECKSLCEKLRIKQFGDPGRTARDFAERGFVKKDVHGNCTYNPKTLDADLAVTFSSFKDVYKLLDNVENNIIIPFSHNRIIFGAPGTGKSYLLDKNLKDSSGADYFKYYERVTFHPSYSYANFVGTYKPVKDEKGNGQITYEFVEGPFIRVLRQALCDPNSNYLLIVEEINRANVTGVFGDIFQLLDRGFDNCSAYEVAASEDLRKHLLKNGVPSNKVGVIKIPSNMYIWATMNSADQGVQPLDTAFKRRWEFEYLNINTSEDKVDENMKNIQFPNNTTMDWNFLRHMINNRISSSYNINEDKLLGPFFIKKGNQSNEQFLKSFKSKVLMYLFEDVCKINPKPLFAGIDKQKLFLSDVVENFDNYGLDIFSFSDDEEKRAKLEIENKDLNATE